MKKKPRPTDKQRLDWLLSEANASGVYATRDGKCGYWLKIGRDVFGFEHQTYRQAIDAAMRGTK